MDITTTAAPPAVAPALRAAVGELRAQMVRVVLAEHERRLAADHLAAMRKEILEAMHRAGVGRIAAHGLAVRACDEWLDVRVEGA